MSTKQAAQQIGVGLPSLYSHLRRGTFPAPGRLAGSAILVWTQADVQAAKDAIGRRRKPAAAA